MAKWTRAQWTGGLGIAAEALQLVGIGFFFAGGEPPGLAAREQLVAYMQARHATLATAALLFFVGFAVSLVFLGGFRAFIAAAATKHAWLADAVFAAGITAIAMAYVAIGMLAAALAEATGNADAGSIRTLWEAFGVLSGAPSLLPGALFVGVAGFAIAQSRVLPRWVAIIGWVAAVLTFVAGLSLYGGNDATSLSSANGPATVLGVLPAIVFTLAVSINLLRVTGDS